MNVSLYSKLNDMKKNEIEVEKTNFVVYRISINGEETYDVLTQDPYDIGSAICVNHVNDGILKPLPMDKWDKIEKLLYNNY